MSSLAAATAAAAGFKKRPRSRLDIPHAHAHAATTDARRSASYGPNNFDHAATGNVRIKDEPTDDIKDYAETTMNEILGWYGYDKVDSRDTQGLNLTHFRGTSNSPDNHLGPGSGSDDAGSSSREGPAGGSEGGGPVGSLTGTGSRPPTAGPTTPNGPSTSPNPPEEGTGSAEDTTGLPSGCIVCAWCQKVGMKLFTLKTTNGSKAFCSELCFTQCRRASFKKNKVCDWCKHVRHTVNYVDFQVEDGDQQLQFCSDKCLNQYKMNIFCRETQAHLQMHPHLQEAANKITGSSGALNLITPDLWLRECKGSTNGHSNDGCSDEREETLPENLSVNAPTELPAVLSASSRKSASPSSVSVPTNPRVETDHHRVQSLPVPAKPRSHHRDKDRSRRIKSAFRHKERRDQHSYTSATAASSSSRARHSARSPSSTCSTPLSVSSTNSHNHVGNGPSPSVNGLGLLGASKQDHSSVTGNNHPSLSIPGLPPPLGPPFPGLGDGLRSPFLPPNMLPNHFNFLAQQQMETLLRLHHNLSLRHGGPPMPLPSGMFPPLPHFPGGPGGPRAVSPPTPSNAPPPLPPPIPPRPPQPPPLQTGNHGHSNHHSHKQNQHHQHEHSTNKPSKSSHHHHHSSQRSSTTPVASSTSNSGNTPATQSLLPPVTVMVPYPIMIPIPIPIPLVFPVPKDFVERMAKSKNNGKDSSGDHETAVNLSNGGSEISSRESASDKIEDKNSPGRDSRNHSPRTSSKRVESVITKLVNSKRRDKKERSSSGGGLELNSPPPPLLPVYDRSLDLEDSADDAESSTPLPDGFSSDDDNTLSDDSDLGKDDALLGDGRTFDSYKVKLKEGGDLTASLVRETTTSRKRSPDKLQDLSAESFKRKCV